VGFGVYVHIPFCSRRCDYCAFATWTDRSALMEPYSTACRNELVGAVTAGMPRATSVFFGGGTPSLLPARLLVGVLGEVPRADDAEVTVECNPETVTGPLLDAYRAAGVNRLSFGVQSMTPHVLAGLGRAHDPASARRAVELAVSAGFDDFNVDLIYGGAGERDVDWQSTLDAVLGLVPGGPPHVSAYALTVEPGTPLAADSARHPDDDIQADRYLRAERSLSAAGLQNYEISNWARPGHECRHNRLYWSQGEYRGIGCAAHSHAGGRRWWNVRTPERFISLVSGGSSAEGGAEVLDADGRRREGLELSLRTGAGVPVGALDDLDLLVERHLVVRRADRLVLTIEGRLLANEVALRLR